MVVGVICYERCGTTMVAGVICCERCGTTMVVGVICCERLWHHHGSGCHML